MKRTAIFAALSERLQKVAPAIVTWSDRPRPATDFAPETQPAAFLVIGVQSSDPEPRPRWTIDAELYLYARPRAGVSAEHQLNELVDQVEAALRRRPAENGSGFWTTLGDLVFSVRVVQVSPGVDEHALEQGIAIVDLEIIAPA